MGDGGVIGFMTGPWLFVKWVGIGILMTYLLLAAIAVLRFRSRLSRFTFVPMAFGIFVSSTLPWLFMKAEVSRGCFVVAQLIFLYGIAILIRNLVQKDQTGLAEG